MVEINEHPNGYLVMDTNCFSHYCEGGKVAGFDYDKIRDFVEREGYWVVITPYTLYECIQNCTTPERIQEERNKWFNARDFWVLNVNKLIGDKYNFEYGPDFLFDFGFDPTKVEEFVQKRNEWRDKVFASLAPRIALLSQIIAIIYVMITERKVDGTLSQTSLIKLTYIDQGGSQSLNLNDRLGEFVKNSARYSKELAEAKDVNARDYLVLFVKTLAFLMLTNARDLIGQLGSPEIILTFNDPQFVEGVTRRMYPHNEMVEKYKLAKNSSKKEYSIDSMIDQLLKGCEPIFKQLYKRVVNEWFMKNYKGKELANTIIDFVNMGVLEVESTLPCVYITEEKGFVSLIRGMKDKKAKATQDFYKEFYVGWDKVVPMKL